MQAKLTTKITKNITVNHIDQESNKIDKDEYYITCTDERYKFKSKQIENYEILDIQKEENDNNINIKFIYKQKENTSNNTSYQDDDRESNSNNTNTNNTTNIDTKTDTTNKVDSKTNITIKDDKLNPAAKDKTNTLKPVVSKNKTVSNNLNNDNKNISIDKNKYKDNTNNNITNRPILSNGNISTNVNKQNIVVNTNKTNDTNIKETTKTNNHSYTKEYIKNLEKEEKYLRETDHFLVNTNMTKEQKEDFLRYINEVAEDSRRKHGNDIHKINHDIANAIAYSLYSTDKLQSMTNDFGEEPKNLNKNIKDLIRDIHYDSDEVIYLIDFPHMGATGICMNLIVNFCNRLPTYGSNTCYIRK